jgi:hypothetical protein
MAFSLFGSRRAAQQPPAPAPAATPAPPAADPNKPADLSPLAQVAEAWKMKVPEQQGEAQKPHSYFGNVDPAKLSAASKNLNFLAGVDPALVEKAKGGDAEAFMQVMNATNQNTFQTAMAAIPAIMEPVLKQVEQQSTAAVPGLFRQMQLRSERPSNPVLNDPAWIPVVEALKTSLASQNPQATPDQIVAQVEKHVEAMVAAAAPKQQQQPPGGRQQPAGDEDYSFLLN